MGITLLVLALFAGAFVLVYRGLGDRRLVMLGCGGLFVLLGWLFDFYTPAMAVEAIYFDTLALLFGMSLISATLARSGLFAVVAGWAARQAMGSGWLTLVFFSLTTWLLSLFVNNLAAIVVILPVTLEQCRIARINPVPVVIAEVIASNIGGASTMVGDFPNMIIASASGLGFVDFIPGMMAPCLVLLAAMLLFFQGRRDSLRLGGGRRPVGGGPGLAPPVAVDPYLRRLGMTVLVLTLIGFSVSTLVAVRPAAFALAAGVTLLALGRFPRERIFEAASGGDMLFFAGLFVMVGGLKAGGVLDGVAWLITTLGNGNSTVELLALMGVAGGVTLFLNAGPSTAFFIPVAGEMSAYISGPAVWWALSLGVLAGSSAALTGATAGPVAASHLENHQRRYPEMTAFMHPARGLGYREFMALGLPLMFVFMGLSAVYIIVTAP